MYMEETALAVHDVCPQGEVKVLITRGTGEAAAAVAASLAIVILAEAG